MTTTPSPPPRPTPLEVGNGRLVIPVLVIIFVSASWVRIAYDGWVLDRRGLSTHAEPVAVEDAYATNRGSERTWSGARVQIAFTAAGQPRRAWIFLSDKASVEKARNHEAIQIDYDPVDPSHARRAGEPDSSWLPLMLGLASAAWLAVVLWQRRRDRHLYRTGSAICAAVVGIVPGVWMRRAAAMEYSFELGDQRFSGRASELTPPLQVGASVWVVYDPAKPYNNIPLVGQP